jgi:hypothetical protein
VGRRVASGEGGCLHRAICCCREDSRRAGFPGRCLGLSCFGLSGRKHRESVAGFGLCGLYRRVCSSLDMRVIATWPVALRVNGGARAVVRKGRCEVKLLGHLRSQTEFGNERERVRVGATGGEYRMLATWHVAVDVSGNAQRSLGIEGATRDFARACVPKHSLDTSGIKDHLWYDDVAGELRCEFTVGARRESRISRMEQ